MPPSVPDIVADCGARTQGQVTPQMLKGTSLGSTLRSRAVKDKALTRVRPGVYALSELPRLPRFLVTDHGVAEAYVAQVRAVLLSLGATATACGRTAAALRGWGLLIEPSRTVDVAVPHGRSRVRLEGVSVTQRRRLARERVCVLQDTDRLWLSSAVQTVLDCCMDLPVLEAVVVGDSALRAGDVNLDQLHAGARLLRGVREAERVRRVLTLLDPQCGSILESVLRYRLLTAGMTGFGTQHTVRATDGTTVRVDFCFEDRGLVVEADGAKWHQDPGPDRQRDNLLARCGLRVLRYTWRDIVHEHSRVAREIEEALAARRADFQLPARTLNRAA